MPDDKLYPHQRRALLTLAAGDYDYADIMLSRGAGRTMSSYSRIGNWAADFLGSWYFAAIEARARALEPQDLARWEDDGGSVRPDDGKPYTNYVSPVKLATRQQRRSAERHARKGHIIQR